VIFFYLACSHKSFPQTTLDFIQAKVVWLISSLLELLTVLVLSYICLTKQSF